MSEVSRLTGKTKGTVSSWLTGSMPSGDTIFLLADALDVNPRWLATGAGDEERHTEATESDDTIRLPVIDLFKFDEGHMPDPVDTLLIRRELLASAVRTTVPLWVAVMPSDTMPDIAREGDQIICRAPDAPLVDGRVYVFLLDGRPLVRRVSVRPEGLVLKAGDTVTDPILIEPDQLERLAPVGRVLAALTVQAV
jgi:transcriptional regulator with XRE-family HTH domain